MRRSPACVWGSRRSRTSRIRSPGCSCCRRSGTCSRHPLGEGALVATRATDRRSFAADLFVASRPLSWINTAFPFAAAYLLTTREIDVALVVGTLFFLVPYNLAMYGINDVFDAASDAANPRKGGAEGALLRPERHRLVITAAIAA